MLQNAVERAKKAQEKKALYGKDIDLEKYIREEIGEHEIVDRITEVPKKVQETLHTIGVDASEKERAGTYIQIDQSGVCTTCLFENVEIMRMGTALEKYEWVEDYMWKAVAPDTDKYTAQTVIKEGEEGTTAGYFIRSLPGSKVLFPLQACMFIGDKGVIQTAHNIIIAEENSEVHIITGCTTGSDVSSAFHIGISEFYLKKGAKITFTMIHNWTEQVDVRPRTGVIAGDDSTFISNYILTSPVRSIQAYPTAYCSGKNSKVLFQSVLRGQQDSLVDIGSRVILEGEGSSCEVVSRVVTKDQSQIYVRGHVAGRQHNTKGHLECRGLVLSDDSMIYAIPELEGSATELELSHEAAVGKIAEEEVLYLMSRGLTEEEAVSMIVRGFLSMDITGLPQKLADETKRILDMSLKGM